MVLAKVIRNNKNLYSWYEKSLFRKCYSYLKKSRERRCLQLYGEKIIHEIMDISRKNDFGIFCVYGTLLGIIRENALIKHDDDLDFGIVCGDGFDFSMIEHTFEKQGYKKMKGVFFDGKMTEQKYRKAGIDIDIFLFYPLKDQKHFVTYVYFRDKEKTYKNPFECSVRYYDHLTKMDQTKWVKFREQNVLIPENSEQFLYDIYGCNWRKPDPNFKSLAKVLPDNKRGELKIF